VTEDEEREKFLREQFGTSTILTPEQEAEERGRLAAQERQREKIKARKEKLQARNAERASNPTPPPLVPPQVPKVRPVVAENESNVRNLFGDVEPETPRVLVPEPGNREPGSRKKYRPELGKRWTEILTDIKAGDYTWEEFVSELSPTELARGQLKDSKGTFTGRPPSLVPRAFFNACTKELLKRGNTLYRDNYVDAVGMMMEIGRDRATKPETRLKALQFVIERIEGKIPEKVEVTVDDPWQKVLDGVIAEVTEDGAIGRAHDYLSRQQAAQNNEEGN